MINKKIKWIRLFYRFVFGVVVVVGLLYSYAFAEFGDAPGIIIIGGTLILGVSAILYGIGELVVNSVYNKETLDQILHTIEEKNQLGE